MPTLCKVSTILFFAVILPVPAAAENLCPKVAPNAQIEIQKVRPLPNDQWGIAFSGEGFAGERTVNEGDPKFQFGQIYWYTCDITNPSPPSAKELAEFMKLAAALAPNTDTRRRSVTSKASNWDEKIAPTDVRPEKLAAVISARPEQQPSPAVVEYATGTASIYVVAVKDDTSAGNLSGYSLLKNDLIFGLNNMAFKSETDAQERIKSANKNIANVLNVVRQGKYLVLTNAK